MSHSERVRRNYRCATCDGDGRIDDYEPCYKCGGTGVILTPEPPPTPPTGRSFLSSDWLVKEQLMQLRTQLLFAERYVNLEPGSSNRKGHQ